MEETTSRRARLEQELGLLQQDVASLCSKLQRAPNFAAAEEAPNDAVATLPPSEPKRETNALGRVARPFFFGDDDTYRDARFKLTPRMLDSNWVVRKAVGQRPAVLGKQLKQWYWRGADLCINQIVAARRNVALSPCTRLTV